MAGFSFFYHGGTVNPILFPFYINTPFDQEIHEIAVNNRSFYRKNKTRACEEKIYLYVAICKYKDELSEGKTSTHKIHLGITRDLLQRVERHLTTGNYSSFKFMFICK
jgi:hypothetical protein